MAGRRPDPARVLARGQPVRRRSASRHRHRHRGRCPGAGAGDRRGYVRGIRTDARPHRHDLDCGWVQGFADAPGAIAREEGCARRRGRRDCAPGTVGRGRVRQRLRPSWRARRRDRELRGPTHALATSCREACASTASHATCSCTCPGACCSSTLSASGGSSGSGSGSDSRARSGSDSRATTLGGCHARTRRRRGAGSRPGRDHESCRPESERDACRSDARRRRPVPESECFTDSPPSGNRGGVTRRCDARRAAIACTVFRGTDTDAESASGARA
jgi:hypothetical protein